MKELASQRRLESNVFIQYVIDGIQDDANSKLVLYGENWRIEEKLKVYEAIWKKKSREGKKQKSGGEK